MGSKFSPSLANLFMSYWEEFFIFSDRKPFGESIAWYGGYINDHVIIWDRDVIFLLPMSIFLTELDKVIRLMPLLSLPFIERAVQVMPSLTPILVTKDIISIPYRSENIFVQIERALIKRHKMLK